METSWLQRLHEEFDKPYLKELERFLMEEYRNGVRIYPSCEQIFAAFCQCPFDQVRVVIIGQDPYHGPGQAHGLAFSVPQGVAPPPSLQNIFKELQADVGIKIPSHGCLTSWAKQGVMLLNTILTVRAGEAKSHHGKGWEIFTDRVVQLLCKKEEPIVFLLWGKSASEKVQSIYTSRDSRIGIWDSVKAAQNRSEERGAVFGIQPPSPPNDSERFDAAQMPILESREVYSQAGQLRHLILQAPHPSPLSAHTGFFGCRHFSKTNTFFQKMDRPLIDWTIDECQKTQK